MPFGALEGSGVPPCLLVCALWVLVCALCVTTEHPNMFFFEMAYWPQMMHSGSARQSGFWACDTALPRTEWHGTRLPPGRSAVHKARASEWHAVCPRFLILAPLLPWWRGPGLISGLGLTGPPNTACLLKGCAAAAWMPSWSLRGRLDNIQCISSSL